MSSCSSSTCASSQPSIQNLIKKATDPSPRQDDGKTLKNATDKPPGQDTLNTDGPRGTALNVST